MRRVLSLYTKPEITDLWISTDKTLTNISSLLDALTFVKQNAEILSLR
jgi:hypothetical protein